MCIMAGLLKHRGARTNRSIAAPVQTELASKSRQSVGWKSRSVEVDALPVMLQTTLPPRIHNVHDRIHRGGDVQSGKHLLQFRKVICRLFAQRSNSCQVFFEASWPSIVSSKETGLSEAVMQFAKIRGAGHDVVVRIEWIGAQLIPCAQLRPGPRHDLHQTYSAFGRHGRGIAATFDPHDCQYPCRRNAKTLRSFVHKPGERFAGRVLC